MGDICKSCKKEVEKWNKECGGCGFTLVLEPDEKRQVRYLRTPSIGALFFTQGWTFGARLYMWFLLSLVPVFGIVALIVCVFFGRRWSWKYGGWSDWEEFTQRMRAMDIIGTVWLGILIASYFIIKFT